MKNLKNIFTLFILVLIASCSKDSDETATPYAPASALTISPATGPKNTIVTVTGADFSTIATSNSVTINAIPCVVNSATATELKITIPPAAGSGTLKIFVNNSNRETEKFEFIFTTTVTTIAGSTLGNADGQGANAQFNTPFGIAIDGTRTLFIADTRNHRIRKISPSGLVTTIAGSTAGFADGQGAVAQLNIPIHIARNATGDLFVADKLNHKIRKISNTGAVETYAGSTQGFEVGERLSAKFNGLFGITNDELGNLYVTDSNNFKIRKIPILGNVLRIAGNVAGIADGQGSEAQFTNSEGIEIDAAGNLYVADDGVSKLIRKISPTGLVTTLAGGAAGFADGQGADARFSDITDIAVDAAGNLFVTDKHRIRKISPTGLVTTIAGSDTAGFADGDATTAQFNITAGIAIDQNGNLYVADSKNNRIRKITID